MATTINYIHHHHSQECTRRQEDALCLCRFIPTKKYLGAFSREREGDHYATTISFWWRLTHDFNILYPSIDRTSLPTVTTRSLIFLFGHAKSMFITQFSHFTHHGGRDDASEIINRPVNRASVWMFSVCVTVCVKSHLARSLAREINIFPDYKWPPQVL